MADAFSDMFEQFHGVRAEMERIRSLLRSRTIDSSSGPVRITMNGCLEVVSVSLSPGFADDPRALEDAIRLAVNNGIVKSQNMAARELGALLGPGLPFGGLGGTGYE